MNLLDTSYITALLLFNSHYKTATADDDLYRNLRKI